MMGLPEGSIGFAICLSTYTHYRLVNVLGWYGRRVWAHWVRRIQ